MAIGKRRKTRQRELFVATSRIRARGSPFYRALDELLEESGFDAVSAAGGPDGWRVHHKIPLAPFWACRDCGSRRGPPRRDRLVRPVRPVAVRAPAHESPAD